MAIKVTVAKKDGAPGAEYRGENVTVDGVVMKIHTEPHEIKPGGLVDLFVGDVVVLEPGDVVHVRRI